jgi:hypothetical protein
MLRKVVPGNRQYALKSGLALVEVLLCYRAPRSIQGVPTGDAVASKMRPMTIPSIHIEYLGSGEIGILAAVRGAKHGPTS